VGERHAADTADPVHATTMGLVVVVVAPVVVGVDERVALEVLRLVDLALGVTAGDLLAGGVLVRGDATVAAIAVAVVAAAATAGVSVLVRRSPG
jgi:hypothetical protein